MLEDAFSFFFWEPKVVVLGPSWRWGKECVEPTFTFLPIIIPQIPRPFYHWGGHVVLGLGIVEFVVLGLWIVGRKGNGIVLGIKRWFDELSYKRVCELLGIW